MSSENLRTGDLLVPSVRTAARVVEYITPGPDPLNVGPLSVLKDKTEAMIALGWRMEGGPFTHALKLYQAMSRVAGPDHRRRGL